MPPFPVELETWWLGPGTHLLTQLLHGKDRTSNPREIGFVQATQRRLRSFDHCRDAPDQIEQKWPSLRSARGFDYDANPRKKLKESLETTFRKIDDGGIDHSRVMDGLGVLDTVEVRRLQLIEATKLALRACVISERRRVSLVEELHGAAGRRFAQCHMGFRVCVS